jgi:hypothetical protein
MKNNVFQNPFFMNIILLISIIIITCIVSYYNTHNIQLKIAYKGLGPQDYINHKILPENFKKNWENGVMAYDFSLPMKAYYYLYKHFGISPSTTIYPFMFIQTLIFLISVAFLTQSLFQNKYVTIISIFIIPVSNLAGLNLSRFGSGFGSYLSFPLFYAYANAFRIFALGFFLKNKYILMFTFLALAVYCHVTMGFITLAFIGGYLIYKPRFFINKSVQLGILIFLILTIPHIYIILSHSANSHSGIPTDQWIKLTRIFSSHWYPITLKLFTINAHREFFPLLMVSIFFLASLKYHNIKDEKTLKIVSGIVICLILSLIGIIFSDIYPVPFFVTLSLQRSTGMISFFGVLYLVYYLFKKINYGNAAVTFIAVYSLLTLVFAKPGIVLLPLLILFYNDISENQLGLFNFSYRKRKIIKIIYVFAIIPVLLISFVSILNMYYEAATVAFGYLWTPLQYVNPFHNFDFLLRGGSFKVQTTFLYLILFAALSACLIKSIISINSRIFNILITSFIIIVSLSGVWYLEWNKYLKWHNKYSEDSSAYFDLQLWAKNNTDGDSLFLPDPSHNYGWRDFSERSSFGNLREWGYTNIAYNPDYGLYQEGLSRMRQFGIDIDKLTYKDIKNSVKFSYGSKLVREIQKNYYALSAQQLKNITIRNEINYAIMKKKYQIKKYDLLEIAFENDHYVVYRF